MVGESLERRRAVAQRMQVARDQQMALESLRKQELPDGRRLEDADADGMLFDIFHALQNVVRRHNHFQLDLTTREGLRLRLLNEEGNLAVNVVEERRGEEQAPDVIDLRSPRPTTQAPDSGKVPPEDDDADDGSALTAALRRQRS